MVNLEFLQAENALLKSQLEDSRKANEMLFYTNKNLEKRYLALQEELHQERCKPSGTFKYKNGVPLFRIFPYAVICYKYKINTTTFLDNGGTYVKDKFEELFWIRLNQGDFGTLHEGNGSRRSYSDIITYDQLMKKLVARDKRKHRGLPWASLIKQVADECIKRSEEFPVFFSKKEIEDSLEEDNND